MGAAYRRQAHAEKAQQLQSPGEDAVADSIDHATSPAPDRKVAVGRKASFAALLQRRNHMAVPGSIELPEEETALPETSKSSPHSGPQTWTCASCGQTGNLGNSCISCYGHMEQLQSDVAQKDKRSSSDVRSHYQASPGGRGGRGAGVSAAEAVAAKVIAQPPSTNSPAAGSKSKKDSPSHKFELPQDLLEIDEELDREEREAEERERLEEEARLRQLKQPPPSKQQSPQQPAQRQRVDPQKQSAGRAAPPLNGLQRQNLQGHGAQRTNGFTTKAGAEGVRQPQAKPRARAAIDVPVGAEGATSMTMRELGLAGNSAPAPPNVQQLRRQPPRPIGSPASIGIPAPPPQACPVSPMEAPQIFHRGGPGLLGRRICERCDASSDACRCCQHDRARVAGSKGRDVSDDPEGFLPQKHNGLAAAAAASPHGGPPLGKAPRM